MECEISRVNLLLSSALNAAYILVVQVAALVALSPREFGEFSLVYLLFALSSSLCLSLVCEAWSRRQSEHGELAEWLDYSTALVFLSIATAILSLVVLLLIGPLRDIAVLGCVAVAASSYRVGARYFAMRQHEMRSVIAGDAAGILSFGLGFAGIAVADAATTVTFTGLWALSSVFSALLSKPPRVGHPRLLVMWWRDHRTQAKVLVSDSLLINASSIGTPFALSGLLGIASFGVYRAVANVAAPVRLALTPLAPVLASTPLALHRGRRRLAAYASVSAFFGAAAWAALELVNASGLDLGTLSAVSVYSIPVGIFVGANFVGHLTSIIARAHLASRSLVVARAIHSALGITLPLGGVVLAGLDGAIWGQTLSIVVASLIWVVLLLTAARTART